ncbi:MAG: hypothetical protein LBG74_03895 [Spirochaetaceae bacterium]|jgi:hypothetical protein|nr:hypothetical protein [Spirochaetaceae bacterium]
MRKTIFIIIAVLSVFSCDDSIIYGRKIIAAEQTGKSSPHILFEGEISIWDINIDGALECYSVPDYVFEEEYGKNSFHIKVMPSFIVHETVTVSAHYAEGRATFRTRYF